MKKGNIAGEYRKKVLAIHRKIAGELVRAAKQLGQVLLDETRERTPADQGDLRMKWAQMPVEKKGDRYFIKITNPAQYAAFVEFGYMQRPGMILKMKEDGKGRLRFVEFLGYSAKYGLGEPTGKVPPDKDGYVTIITRKRFIAGRFMAREGLRVTKETHWPQLKRYILARMKKTWGEGQ